MSYARARESTPGMGHVLVHDEQRHEFVPGGQPAQHRQPPAAGASLIVRTDDTKVLAELPGGIVSGACATSASSSIANMTVVTPAAPQLSPRPSLIGPAGARPVTAS